jgi:phosphoribosylanthranilate isomerase
MVKICGLTNHDDALAALRAGADYLGFILVPRTPRYVSASNIKKIIKSLPHTAKFVGVFRDHPVDQVLTIMDEAGLDIAQLHGNENEVEIGQIGRDRVWKVLPVTNDEQVEAALNCGAGRVLIDTFVKGQVGGTGQTGNWELARRVAEEREIILAGGLNPENVYEAVKIVQPFGVDVSSGVEQAPGVKDRDKVAEFIRRAKVDHESMEAAS